MVQNELMKLYFALLNVSLYYFGYFVGVNNFVYMSVHSMSLLLTLCNFVCVKNNNHTTTCKILGPFSALHILGVQLDAVFLHMTKSCMKLYHKMSDQKKQNPSINNKYLIPFLFNWN